ncbi:hypothetical protein ES703_15867 [subsurface metagenome]
MKVVIGISIKVEATASTWREDELPYDIYGAIKEKLEKAGFEVVPPESTVYDAILLINYREEIGEAYRHNIDEPIVGRGTDIRCNLRLENKTQGLIFEKKIFSYTPNIVQVESKPDLSPTLYSYALKDFQREMYFKYLSEIIATKLGVGDEVSVVICAIADDELERLEECAVESLIEALKTGEWVVQEKVTEALGKIGEPAVEPLIHALKDEDIYVRGGAIEALGWIGEPAVEPLIHALKDEDIYVRGGAAEALGWIGDKRAVEPLIEALKDEDYLVRMRVAEALGRIGDARAVEPLTQALEDENWSVQNAAKEALKKIKEK